MKALLLAAGVLLLAAAPARADSVSDAVSALRSSPVYQAPGLDLVDTATLSSELSGADPRVDVAVLPASAARTDDEARARAIEIGRALADSNLVVLVITANQHLGTGEGNGVASRGVDARGALVTERGSLAGFTKADLDALVLSFAQRLADQAARPQQGVSTTGSSGSGSSSAGWLLGGLAVLAVGGVLLLARSSRQRKERLNEGLKAEVEQLYERLAADVLNLDPGDNAAARQALADASERYSACGGQLASADAPAEFAAARRTAVEGLTAARTARIALGLDPGPEVPLVPGDGPQLAADEKVTVAGQTYDGSPQYTPGRPHYFGGGMVGGQQVPGGWYSGNFWAPFLLGSVLGGGFGGFGGDDDGGTAGGGDWSGSSGGGDWGGGGGGGGDW